MKEFRFSDEQIVQILRKTYRDSIAEVAERHEVSETSIYSWHNEFFALETNEVRRLKDLKAENARLRKLLVDRDLEIEVMKKINAKMVCAQAHHTQARYPITRGAPHVRLVRLRALPDRGCTTRCRCRPRMDRQSGRSSE